MKRLAILLSLVLLVALAACRQAPATETQPTVEGAVETLPTEAPAVEEPAAATDEPATTVEEPSETTPLAHTTDPALIDKLWLWERRDAATPIEVPNPSEYNLIFNADGTFFAQLDCNRGGGSYATPGDGSLMMELGMTSMALCPEDSLINEMMATFPAAAQYRIEEEGAVLVIVWADGASDTYRAADATSDTTPAGAVDAALVGKTWQWLGTITAKEPVTVADSTRYTIEFQEDGTAAIKADCNIVIAQFTADGSAMSILPGPSTLVACPEDSQADLFTQQLSGAAIYFFQDGDLFIDLMADSGTMHFSELPDVDLLAPETGAPTGTVNAPDGVFLRTGPGTNFPSIGAAPLGESGTLIGISQDRAWYVVEAPSVPDGRVWVAAAFVDAVNADNLPTVTTPALPSTLVGRTWQWTGTIAGTQTLTVADPSRYTITFVADGTASIKADCNMVTAQYTVAGSSLSIIPGASTMAMCPEDSQDQLFVQQLSAAATHFFQGDELFISQLGGGGTMRFMPAGAGGVTVAPPGNTVTGGASGLPFRVVSFGPAGAEQPVVAGTTLTVTFDEAALGVSGNSGCNSFAGSLIPQNGFFTVGPLASTMMACATAGVMEQEAAFLAALQGTTGYRWTQTANAITSGQLTYTLADGTSGVINLATP
ncbi:MAG: META domain-containing protein [Candidatus Promineofilum sp.]|nr:META domain-containing protein [Promineifilum sp.]